MQRPILTVRDGQPQRWSATTIRALHKDEAYLEKLIGGAPELLGLEDPRTRVAGPYHAFHQLGVKTPLGQVVAPDIVFLTGSGDVVVVEVKLDGNPELRGRRVIAQAVEYAASLSSYPEEELVELFDPKLPEGSRFSDLVRKHLPNVEDPVALARVLVDNIQRAKIHIVVACDRAPEGMRELVASVSAQQALGNYELRVAEVVPYVTSGAGEQAVMLVPGDVTHTEIVGRTVVEVVDGDGDTLPNVTVKVTSQEELEANLGVPGGKPAATPEPTLVAALQAYAAVAVPGTRLSGASPHYRAVRVEGWPGAIHYEFLYKRSDDAMGVELHFEANVGRAAADAVRAANLKPSPALPGLTWDQKWSSGRGRLRAVFPGTSAPEVFARAMRELIERTRSIVDDALGAGSP